MAESSLLMDLVEKASKIVADGLAYKITREALKSTTNQLAPLVDQIEQCIKETDLPIDGIENLKGNLKATQELLRKYPRLRWWQFYMSNYFLLKIHAAEKSLVSHISVHMQMKMARDLEVIRSNLISDGSHSRQILLADETHKLIELKFDLNLSALPANYLLSRTPSSSSSFFASVSESLRKHDVFISFRGDDIRTGFKSHLCDALSRKNIDAYVDDRLDKGDEIWPGLVRAIKDSVLFLVIFSENYASSKWCLRELTQILESTKNRSHRVMPVFYEIDPSHVRNQTGSYHKAFTEHQHHHHDEEEVSKWRENLNRAGNLVGWDSRAYRNEVDLIQKIVTCVTKKLDTMFQSVYSSGLFGIDEQIAEIESLLCNESQDVQVIGIWGMAGIGKTTISTQLLNKLCHEFESSCFLDNIREESEKNSISFLRRKLLSTLLEDDKLCVDMSSTGGPTNNDMRRLGRKRVIVVLDDVNDPLQLVDLVRAPSEFGKGSKIIITARDKQVFGKTVNNTNIYEVKALNFDDALQLFKFHAMNDNGFEKEFEQLSHKVVDYAKGFPSTLVALGSFLYGKSIEEWKRKWEKITKISCTEIHKILKLSYDGMDEEKKSLLLDIASTLNDREAERIMKFLDEFGYSKIHGLTEILEGSNDEQKKEGDDEKLDPSDHEDMENMGLQLMKIKHSNFR